MDSYEEYKERVKEEQKNLDYEEVKTRMEKRSEFMVELDHLPSQNHIWVDRGAVLSCENAGHPNHHAYKRVK